MKEMAQFHKADKHTPKPTNPVFRLRDLIKPSFDLWLISWGLGLLTVFAVLGLLMVSGWFISAAALAGMVALGSHALII